MTAQRITTSTTSTTSTTKNYITDSGGLTPQQSLMKALSEGSLDPEAVASPGGVGQEAFGSVIPPEWAYIKIDLFDNTPAQDLAAGRRRLKLALAVLRARDQEWNYFRASLNGPWRNVRRGLDLVDPDDREHYQVLARTRDDFVDAGLVPRTSKFYERGFRRKGQTICGLSTVVAALPQDGHWIAAIVYGSQVIVRTLDGSNRSAAQRQAGIIATTDQGRPGRVRAQDLFR